MKPNIVIIVLDAVRADHLPFYGYQRNTTPFLKSIQNELAVYRHAVSSSYWTLPSIASLFTGTYASLHGLLVDGDRLNPSLCTLPELLHNNGYQCQAFVNNVFVSEYSGLDRGFDRFYKNNHFPRAKQFLKVLPSGWTGEVRSTGFSHTFGDRRSKKEAVFNLVARAADVLTDRGSGRYVKIFSHWLRGRKTEPFFCYFHIFETHSPYRAPLHYALNFLSIAENLKKFSINHDHLRFLLNECRMVPEDFAILKSAYDNSIVYADAIIEKIYRVLQQEGALDNTLLAILADHGENIGEHGMMFHYFCLYDTLIRIPLLIRYPEKIGINGRMDQVVQNVDIYPTILSMLDSPNQHILSQMEGNDLLGTGANRDTEIAISELIKPFGPDRMRFKNRLGQYNRRLLSVRTKNRKFIHSSVGDHEYYNLKIDPGEQNNLYGADVGHRELAEKAQPYLARFDQFYKRNREKIDTGFVGNAVADSQIVEQLKSLGYM